MVNSDSNSLKVTWNPPADDGGRNDVSYTVEYQKASLLHLGYMQAGRVGVGRPLMFTITGLKPVTEYQIRIISHNGVTESDVGGVSLESRTCTTTGTTTEGAPAKITVFANTRGTTFCWQPPVETNGNITGYVCKVCRGEQETDINLLAKEFCFSPGPADIPFGEEDIFVKVAAKTAVGVGEFSDDLPVVFSKKALQFQLSLYAYVCMHAQVVV
jgi:ephrin-A